MRKVISTLEVAGGLLIVAGAFVDSPRRASWSPPVWFFPAQIAVGVLSIIAGALLWRGTPTGRRLSIWVQVAQLLNWSGPMRFVYFTGCAIQVQLWDWGLALVPRLGGEFAAVGRQPAVNLAGIGIGLSTGMTFDITLPHSPTFVVGLNLLAIFALRELLRMRVAPITPQFAASESLAVVDSSSSSGAA